MSVALRSPRRQVDDEISKRNDRSLRQLPAPHQCSNPRQQLLEGKRLGQVIVGPGVQPAHPVRDSIACGQEQHRRASVRLPQPLEKRQAILIGKPPIQQNQVPFTRPKCVPGRCPIAGMLHHISFLAQPAHQKVCNVRLILDNQ